MELLIVFIVITVISSIMRSFKRTGGTAEPQPKSHPDLTSREKSYYEEETPLAAYEDGFQRKRPVTTPLNPVKEKIVSHQKTGDFNSPLADLLLSDRITLGIAVSEVLSAPRARRPFKAGGIKRS